MVKLRLVRLFIVVLNMEECIKSIECTGILGTGGSRPGVFYNDTSSPSKVVWGEGEGKGKKAESELISCISPLPSAQ